jgi:hypothetical protein
MKSKILLIASLAIFLAPIALACTPDYVCPEWGACENGLQTRSCLDSSSCGLPPNIERRLCSSNEAACKVDYTCSEWSQCSYTDKTEDILASNIKFAGYEERACADLNGCADNFVEQRDCADTFKVKFVKIEQCGTPFLVALDQESQRQVSEIDLDAWKHERLDISFIQSNFSYCPTCYNGAQDDNEEGIDCGGSCKACVDEKGVTNQIVLVASSWFISLLIFSSFIFSSFFDKRTRVRYLIYKAYKAIDEKDKAALQRHVKKIKEHYRKMPASQRAVFDRELERLYRRV